ncbi:MAG: glycosyltransferase family 4 protein [Weeksellaceae bacterium]|nr:glycosyltransferase family 4 protein [Weeksellaceae bacterium]
MKDKIRILHIQETIYHGGVERRKLSLAKLLPKDTYHQHFVCTHALGTIPDQIRAEGYDITEIDDVQHPFQWSQHRKIQNIISKYKPHIIHGSVFEGMTFAAIDGSLMRVPIKIMEETSDPVNRSSKASLLLRLMSRFATTVIAVSPQVAQYLHEVAKIPSNKIKIIPNGVEVRSAKDSSLPQASIPIPQNAWVIGSVGRMWDDEHKRFSDLIRAFSEIRSKIPQAHLLLVGDGPVKDQYIALVKELDLENQVYFAGFQEDPTYFYNMMNVFALPSAREAFGLVVVEAMLQNIPVVASEVGGIPSIIMHQQTGYLITPKNPDQLAETLLHIHQNPAEAAQVAQSGYEHAFKNFSAEAYVERVQNLYQQLIKAKIPHLLSKTK